MKKRSCMMLAVLLAMLQVLAAFAVLPIAAEANDALTYTIKSTTDTITIDGTADEAIWATATPVKFVDDSANSRAATYQVVWAEGADADTMKVYFLISVVGYQGYKQNNNVQIQLESADGTEKIWTAGAGVSNINTLHDNKKPANGSKIDYTSNEVTYQAAAVRSLGADKTSTLEFAFTMKKTDSIKFDVLVSWHDATANAPVTYSWAGMTATGADTVLAGTGKIAGNKTADYEVVKTAESVTVDGETTEEAWATANALQFVEDTANKRGATFQAMWEPCADDETKMNVYFAISVLGYVGYKSNNHIQLQIESADGTEKIWTGDKSVTNVNTLHDNKKPANGSKIDYTNSEGVAYKAAAVRVLGEDKTSVFELAFTMKKTEDIKFDVIVSWNDAATNEPVYYSWKGMTAVGADATVNGTGLLVESSDDSLNGDVLLKNDRFIVGSLKKDADGKVTLPDCDVTGTMIGWKDSNGTVYPVGGTYTVTGTEQVTLTAVAMNFGLLSGASVLIEEPTALRFEVALDVDAFTALGITIQSASALVIETSLLTDAILTDKKIEAAELDAAQIAYDKVDFTTTSDADIYYAVKENIADVTVAYSACATVTVKYADETVKTFAVEYVAESHSRSVKQVSELAYADRTNIRGEVNGRDYDFKVSKDYAVGDFTIFSYSPYTEEQLDLLAKFKK